MRPSLIRVEADEVTYNLHVMVRVEIEIALLTGAISTADAPAYWNSKMKEYLGVVPDTDANGILQDMHWSIGLFGYFATYTLGNLIALQLWEQYKKDDAQWADRIQRGEFGTLARMAACGAPSARPQLSTARSGEAHHWPFAVDDSVSRVSGVEIRRVVRYLDRGTHVIHLRVTASTVGPDDLVPAVSALHKGGVVAFPTETFYGLAVDPRSAAAVKKIFELKRRAPDQPLPLIACDIDQVVDHVGTMTPLAARLASRGWPGPLTLIILRRRICALTCIFRRARLRFASRQMPWRGLSREVPATRSRLRAPISPAIRQPQRPIASSRRSAAASTC